MSNICSISITTAQKEFIDQHSYLKLSKICQNAINLEMEKSNIQATNKENEHLRIRLADVVEKMQNAINFIEKKGFIDEYLKEVLEK